MPELDNAVLKEAVRRSQQIAAVEAESLGEACQLVQSDMADAVVAGIDYTSREVILACRDGLGVIDKTFSSCFVLKRGSQTIIVADAATCKNPSEQQLYDIVLQTHQTAAVVLESRPLVAMLSFSTLGSGGHDESMTKIQKVVSRVEANHPEIVIDGELQLDAAVNSRVGSKKAPGSQVAGRANVLICPDLNSGNILYKSLEQFGGFVAAGPILQGLKAPASDLSRGSTVEDVQLVFQVIAKLVERRQNG